MNSDIFIKVSLDAAIKKYLLFRNKKDVSLASDFLVYVICMLIYIYSETDILNPYINRQNNGEDGFKNNLGKFGLPYSKINKFFNDLEGYYEIDHYNKVNRLTKNEFFSYLQEDIIDMFFDIMNDNTMIFILLDYTFIVCGHIFFVLDLKL